MTAVTVFTGCAERNPVVERSEVVAHLTDEVIVPAYDELAEAGRHLLEDVGAHCSSLPTHPDPGNQQAHQAPGAPPAKEAAKRFHQAWRAASVLDFGPIDRRRSERWIDFQPFDEARLRELLAGAASDPTVEAVRDRWPSGARGIRALEALLQSESDLVPESIECQFVVSMASILAEESEELNVAWSTYSHTFKGDGGVSLTTQEAINRIVRGMVFALEDTVDGTFILEDPSVALSELELLTKLYLGQTGPGLKDLVEPLAPETDARVKEALHQAFQELSRSDPAQGQTAGESALERVEIVLTTEVASALGVSIGFSDNDGDSG